MGGRGRWEERMGRESGSRRKMMTDEAERLRCKMQSHLFQEGGCGIAAGADAAADDVAAAVGPLPSNRCGGPAAPTEARPPPLQPQKPWSEAEDDHANPCKAVMFMGDIALDEDDVRILRRNGVLDGKEPPASAKKATTAEELQAHLGQFADIDSDLLTSATTPRPRGRRPRHRDRSRRRGRRRRNATR
uniref:DRY_EERY domain-containing protein n=1 Tax=Macrostomum lignano TaxID=282301 RepID=A0A1I8IYP6_9PLAT